MEEAILLKLAEQAAAIAKEMSESLKRFGKEVATLYYAVQLKGIPVSLFPEDIQLNKFDNRKANERLKRMTEDGKKRWKYASEGDKRKVAEMEAIVFEGQNRIKKLYIDSANGPII